MQLLRSRQTAGLALALLAGAPLRASGTDGWRIGQSVPAAIRDTGNRHAARTVLRHAVASPERAQHRIGAAPGRTMALRLPRGWPVRLFCGAALLLVLWGAYRLGLRFVGCEIRSRLLDRLREREGVARDIHDSLLQAIQALMLRFQLVADGLPPEHPARRDLDTAMEEADAVVVEGRDRLCDLRRIGGLDDPAAALREIADRQLAGSGVVATIRSSGTPRRLDPVAWEALADIAAERMFGIARHAHAAVMVVDIAYRAQGLTLRIADDGVGILPQPAAMGRPAPSGVAVMHARAARIGGSVRLSARRRGGTAVVVTVPATMVYRFPSDTH